MRRERRANRNLAKIAMLIGICGLIVAARFLAPPAYAGRHSLVPAVFGFLATAIGCSPAVAVHGRRLARISVHRVALVAAAIPAILMLEVDTVMVDRGLTVRATGQPGT